MSAEQRYYEQRRDQALRDLLELDNQVGAGELSADVETRLRSSYEQEAATAIAELDQLAKQKDDPDVEDTAVRDAPRNREQSRPRYLLYGLGILALTAAGFLLPGYVMDRPDGGFVTGNEALENGEGTSGDSGTGFQTSGRDLDKVTNQELEAVVAATPEVIGMRLVLADRYTAEGRYDLAVVHYGKVIEIDPGNADAKARLGWLMLQLGESKEAARLVEEALAVDPELLDALWFKANIRLYGFDDANGALEVIETMLERPDLDPEVRDQVEKLRRDASQRLADGA